MTTPAPNTIAVVSPLGGIGRTTLTAHLATLAAAQGLPCLAIDLCAENMLGRHLGAQQATEAGWATLAAQQQWWGNAALGNSAAVDLLPFGSASAAELALLQRAWAQSGDWLGDRLKALEVPTGSLIFLDTPAWPAPLACQALTVADTVLVVLESSARACHAQALVAQALTMAPAAAHCAIVINRIDPRRPSQRSALETLRQQWGALLLPYAVHEDENITQASAHATSVCAWAPHAQSSHDLQGISQWLLKPWPALPEKAAEPAPAHAPLSLTPPP